MAAFSGAQAVPGRRPVRVGTGLLLHAYHGPESGSVPHRAAGPFRIRPAACLATSAGVRATCAGVRARIPAAERGLVARRFAVYLPACPLVSRYLLRYTIRVRSFIRTDRGT